MNEETRQRIATYEALFEHPGWRLFIVDVEGWKDSIATSWKSLSPETLRFDQGRHDGLTQVTGFPDLIAAIKADEEESEFDA